MTAKVSTDKAVGAYTKEHPRNHGTLLNQPLDYAPSPQAPGWKAQGWYMTCPRYSVTRGSWEENSGALVVPADSHTPPGAAIQQLRRSGKAVLCHAVTVAGDDLVSEVKVSHQEFLFLHISSGNVACTGSVLSLGKGKDSSMKLPAN